MQNLILLAGCAAVFLAAEPPGQSPLLLAETAKFSASDGNASGFQPAVAVDGDTVVVGAWRAEIAGNTNQGAIYVFEKSPGGWASGFEVAKLVASDGVQHDGLGTWVAIDGDTIVAGAPHSTGLQGPGAVYVFERPPSGWVSGTETAKLTASNAVSLNELGRSVSIDGDTIVAVGQPGSSPFPVYVFVRPASGWVDSTETARLTRSTGGSSLESVWVGNDTVVAGAPFAGEVLVFEKPAGGWASANETAILTPSFAGTDFFGWSVSGDGASIAVGAPLTDVGGNVDRGAAFVFVRPPGGWANATETAMLTASDGAADDQLGRSASVSGSAVVVGAVHVDLRCPEQGAAYLFEEPPAGWVSGTEIAKLLASDGGNNDRFGGTGDASGGVFALRTRGASFSPWAVYVFATPYSQVAAPAPPSLAAIAPPVLANVSLPRDITLTGSGLDCLTSVTVAGVPQTITTQNRSLLTFRLADRHPIGTSPVVVTGLPGSSNQLTVRVDASHPSVLAAPSVHSSGQTAAYRTYTDTGWNSLYILSAMTGTTALPGIVSFDIGGGLFGNLVAVVTLLADSGGVAELPVTVPPLPVPPLTLFWECLTYDPGIPLGLQVPLETSNAVGVLTLF